MILQLGIHLMERRRPATVIRESIDILEPRMGVLDVLRMVEGHLPEPPERRSVGVHGLDVLLFVASEGVHDVRQVLPAGFAEARRHFSCKEVPVVPLVDGTVKDPCDGTRLHLARDDRRVALAPSLGSRLKPAQRSASGWWWAHKIG